VQIAISWVLDRRDFMAFLERRAELCILFLKLLCQRASISTADHQDERGGMSAIVLG